MHRPAHCRRHQAHDCQCCRAADVTDAPQLTSVTIINRSLATAFLDENVGAGPPSSSGCFIFFLCRGRAIPFKITHNKTVATAISQWQNSCTEPFPKWSRLVCRCSVCANPQKLERSGACGIRLITPQVTEAATAAATATMLHTALMCCLIACCAARRLNRCLKR